MRFRHKRNPYEVQAMFFGPGDQLVFRIPGDVSLDRITQTREALEDKFPDNDVIVLCGVDLVAVRPASRSL